MNPRKTRSSLDKVAGISSAAVAKKTGRSWPQWIALLDKAGGKKMPHSQMARYLHERHGLPGWWAQMVTVGYEQARGLRAVHQKTDGFAAGASKTIDVPLGELYAAWADDAARVRWLGRRKLTVRRATANKSMRITWSDGSSVNVNFYAKGAGKSQVTINHEKLADEAAVQRSKAVWTRALGKLEAHLEG